MNSNTVSILLGNGNGTFQNQKVYSVGFQPSTMVSGDFNSDNALDLVVADYQGLEGTVNFLFGNGDGTFQNETFYQVGSYSEAITVADFNNDSNLDLAVANNADSTVSILLGYGNGTFQNQTMFSAGNGPWFVTTGDLNNDNKFDLAIAVLRDNALSVLFGNGDGTFQQVKMYTSGVAPKGVVVDDFNSDNKLDVTVANSGEVSSNADPILTVFINYCT